MSYIGFYGGLLLLLLGLFFVIILLQKEKPRCALGVSIILIIAVPIWLDRLILHKWYFAIPFESSRAPEEWMDFLGSYLGMAGTIVAGALAYWQTRVNRKQDQELENQKQEISRLQEQIAAYQVRPVIRFKKGTLKIYAETDRLETNMDVYKKIYYSLCGKKPSDDISSFVHIEIPIREKGFVPVETVYMDKIEWQIDKEQYQIQLDEKKYALMNDTLQILIDCNDNVTKLGSSGMKGQEMIQAMMIHQVNHTIKKANYDESHLAIMVRFVNQIQKDRKYRLDYYLYNTGDGNELIMGNPHVDIMGEKDGDENGTTIL